MLLPMLAAMAIKVLFVPASEGIDISGAYVFFTLPMPFSELPITEAQVNSWLVVLAVLFLCLYLTHGIRAGVNTKRQILAEWIVEKTEALVKDNMGEFFMGFAPFIAAVMALSGFSSLSGLLGLFPATSDLNIIAGWSILVFFMITYYKLKCGGPINYLKSFTEPIPLLAPMNVIGEIATPVSMTFRHYGNIICGSVISVLLAAALQTLTNLLLGWLPGHIGEFPFFRIGIPAVLSIYFDVFSGCLQAFIFAMLTMIYISNAFSFEEYMRRVEAKAKHKKKANQ